MIHIILVLTVIVCILLMAVILVQNSKGGGLASGFSSQSQVMGVKRTADFMEKATWTLAGILLVISLLSAVVTDSGGQPQADESEIKDLVEESAVALPSGFNPNAGPGNPEGTE